MPTSFGPTTWNGRPATSCRISASLPGFWLASSSVSMVSRLSENGIVNRSPANLCLSIGIGLLGLAANAAAQAPTFPVSVLVFYDENGNGVLDVGEDVRLPN